MRRLGLVLTAVSLAACGSPEREEEPTAPIGVPAAAVAACERLASDHDVRVLCPGEAPAGAAPIVRLRHEDLDDDPCAYVMNLEALEPDPADRRPSHVLLGGACGELPLAADGEGRWVVEPPASLRLGGSPPLIPGRPPRAVRPHVVSRTSVRENEAIVVRADPFPEGGTNGSHYALVWHEDGATYQVAAHYATGDAGRDPREDQTRALRRFAESLRPR